MQKLEKGNRYTPTDIPHVRSNCGQTLTRISHRLFDNSHTLSPHLISRQGGVVLHEHSPHPAERKSAATGGRFVQRSGEKWRLGGSRIHASAGAIDLTLLESAKTVLTERREAHSSSPTRGGVSCASFL